jgi:hypothetical protein
MPRRKKLQSKKSADEHAHLSLRIENHRVRVSTRINHYVHSPQYAWRDIQDDPVFEFVTHLDIEALCTDPSVRAGDTYDLTIYSDVNLESATYWKLKDVQVVDEHRVPQYRTYRGKEIPIYKPPNGMGTLEKVTGEARWHGTIWAQPRYVNDLLILLGHQRQLYVAIHERKIERQRWIQGVEIQTNDPADE